MDLNADVGAFLGDHWFEVEEKRLRLGEERAKLESQKLMKLVFRYENEFCSVEEDFASRIEGIEKELSVVKARNDELRLESEELEENFDSRQVVLEEETAKNAELREEVRSMGVSHKKKVDSLKLKYEQDKYIANNLVTPLSTEPDAPDQISQSKPEKTNQSHNPKPHPSKPTRKRSSKK